MPETWWFLLCITCSVSAMSGMSWKGEIYFPSQVSDTKESKLEPVNKIRHNKENMSWCDHRRPQMITLHKETLSGQYSLQLRVCWQYVIAWSVVSSIKHNKPVFCKTFCIWWISPRIQQIVFWLFKHSTSCCVKLSLAFCYNNTQYRA